MSGAARKGVTDFGAELRAWRASRGWSQVELGDAIGYSGSFVSDLERGDRMPSTDFAVRCDREFHTPGTFLRWCEAARRGVFPPWFAPIVPHEREAVRIHGWSLGSVPGLLQTDGYARGLIQTRLPQDGDESVERKVAARMDRQAVLARPKPPLLHLVMHEAALRQIVVSPQVMAAQFDKLIKAAGMPGIVLQVLPFTAVGHAGADGPVFVYESADGPAIGYMESHSGGRIVDHPDEVADLRTVIGIIRAVALSPQDSVILMRQIRRDLDGLSEVELQQRLRRRVRRGRGGRRRVRARHQARRAC